MRTVPRGPSDHYLDAFLEHLVHIQRAESTRDTYRDALRVLDRDLKPRGLARSTADEINAAIRSRPTPATRKLYRSAVVAFYARACDTCEDCDNPRNWLDFDPTPWLTPHKAPRGRSRRKSTTELHDILARAVEPYRTWYLLGAGQGLRAVEISRLDREDIDIDATLVKGKGDVERTVPTHPLVWEAVRGLPRGPIALDSRGQRATRKGVDGRGNWYLHRRLGYPNWAMHDLRRWYSTQVHELAGGDIRVTQELLGHASPSTTAIYVDVLGSKKAAAVSGLPLVA